MKDKEKNFICRTCLQKINREHYDENYIVSTTKTIKELLELCFPDLNLAITKNFCLCFLCLKRLSIIYKYFEDCMEAENKITQCLTIGSVSVDSDWADFSNILINRATSNSFTGILEDCNQLDLCIESAKDNVESMSVSCDDSNVCDTLPESLETINAIQLDDNISTESSVSSTVTNENRSCLFMEDVDDVIFVNAKENANAKYFCNHCQSTYDSSNHVCQALPKSSITCAEKCVVSRHTLVDKINERKKPESTEKKLSCWKCHAHFKTRRDLSSHFICSHTALAKCNWCNYTSKSSRDFKSHIQQHVNTKSIYKCKVCSLLYGSKDLHDEHFRTHLTCSKCGCTFKFLENVSKHVCSTNNAITVLQNQDSNTSQHVCIVCKINFGTKTDLDLHLSLTEHAFRCNNCFVYFSTKDVLLSHLQICCMIVEPLVTLSKDISPVKSIPDHGSIMDPEWINYDEQPIVIE